MVPAVVDLQVRSEAATLRWRLHRLNTTESVNFQLRTLSRQSGPGERTAGRVRPPLRSVTWALCGAVFPVGVGRGAGGDVD